MAGCSHDHRVPLDLVGPLDHHRFVVKECSKRREGSDHYSWDWRHDYAVVAVVEAVARAVADFVGHCRGLEVPRDSSSERATSFAQGVDLAGEHLGKASSALDEALAVLGEALVA